MPRKGEGAKGRKGEGAKGRHPDTPILPHPDTAAPRHPDTPSRVTHLYRMGTMTRVRKVEEIIPPIMVQPIGDQRLVLVKVRGTSPRMVVTLVRMIG